VLRHSLISYHCRCFRFDIDFDYWWFRHWVFDFLRLPLLRFDYSWLFSLRHWCRHADAVAALSFRFRLRDIYWYFYFDIISLFRAIFDAAAAIADITIFSHDSFLVEPGPPYTRQIYLELSRRFRRLFQLRYFFIFIWYTLMLLFSARLIFRQIIFIIAFFISLRHWYWMLPGLFIISSLLPVMFFFIIDAEARFAGRHSFSSMAFQIAASSIAFAFSYWFSMHLFDYCCCYWLIRLFIFSLFIATLSFQFCCWYLFIDMPVFYFSLASLHFLDFTPFRFTLICFVYAFFALRCRFCDVVFDFLIFLWFSLIFFRACHAFRYYFRFIFSISSPYAIFHAGAIFRFDMPLIWLLLADCLHFPFLLHYFLCWYWRHWYFDIIDCCHWWLFAPILLRFFHAIFACCCWYAIFVLRHFYFSHTMIFIYADAWYFLSDWLLCWYFLLISLIW